MKKRYITLNPNTDNWFFDSYDDCRVFRGFTYNSLLDSAPNGLLKGIPLYVAIKTRLGDLCIYCKTTISSEIVFLIYGFITTLPTIIGKM